MAFLETLAVWTGWFYVLTTFLVGIPVAWYWAATEHTETYTHSTAAVRTGIGIWFAGAFLILLVTR